MKKDQMSLLYNDEPTNGKATDWRINPRSIQDQVVIKLREAIISGEIPLGERLVENDLAVLLGVSRGPIRDALQQLTIEGLVGHTPRIGRFVQMPTPAVVKEVQEIRGVLEGLAAKKLAEKVKEDGSVTGFEVLKNLVNNMKDSKDRAEYIKNSRIFHETLVSLTENKTLMQFSEIIMNRTALFRQLAGVLPERQHQALEEHEAIVDAILSGDDDQAELITRKHAMNGSIAIQRALMEKIKERSE
jgi:DNA-binding GntR family transcriptional regulator